MHKYDLTVLVKTDLKGEGKDTFVSKLEKSIKAMDGVVGKFSEMGSKQLAYKIKRLGEAQYLNWMVELPPKGVVELRKKLTVDKDIVRHIFVKAD